MDSERIGALSERAELFYRKLMSIVDDFGRIEFNGNVLRSRLYSQRLDQVTREQVLSFLNECTAGAKPLITVYHVGDKKYLQIEDFKQQTRSKSKCPDPPDNIREQPLSDVHSRASSPSPSPKETTPNTTPNAEEISFSRADEKTDALRIDRKAEQAITLSTSRFGDFWLAWSQVRGTAYHGEAVRAWLSVVPDELGSEAIGCTLSYLASLDNPAKGFRPDNFLMQHAKDGFRARFPAYKSNGRAGPDERKRAAMQQFLERMAEEKGQSYG